MNVAPCPNHECLSKAEVFPVDIMGLDEESHTQQRVYCSNASCLMTGPKAKTSAEAVRLWNNLKR